MQLRSSTTAPCVGHSVEVVSNIRQIIVDVILELVDLVADASQGEGYVPEDDDAEKQEREENGNGGSTEKLSVGFDHICYSVNR
jgi:hypothetical protein